MRCKVCNAPGANDGKYIYNLCARHLTCGMAKNEEHYRRLIKKYSKGQKVKGGMMRRLVRSALVVALALLLLVGVVRAQVHYALLTVEVPVDSRVTSDLLVTPDTLTVEAMRPGDQAAYDVVVENRGTVVCKEVFATQRQSSEYLAVQTWPIEELAPMESAVVRVIVTVSEDAPDMTVLSYQLGLVCVQ